MSFQGQEKTLQEMHLQIKGYQVSKVGGFLFILNIQLFGYNWNHQIFKILINLEVLFIYLFIYLFFIYPRFQKNHAKDFWHISVSGHPEIIEQQYELPELVK